MRLGRDARRGGLGHRDGKVRQMRETSEHDEATDHGRCSTLRGRYLTSLVLSFRNVINGSNEHAAILFTTSAKIWILESGNHLAHISPFLSRISIYSESGDITCFINYFENYVTPFFKERKKKRGEGIFLLRRHEFFTRSSEVRGVLKSELHQFQNKRLRTANANNGW